MTKLDIGIFLRRLDHEGVEIAERGREQQLGPVELDHGFHGLGDGRGLGDVLLLDHRDAGDRLQCLRADRMGLVPAEIIARPDIDDADGEAVGGAGAERQPGRCGDGTEGGALHE